MFLVLAKKSVTVWIRSQIQHLEAESLEMKTLIVQIALLNECDLVHSRSDDARFLITVTFYPKTHRDQDV